MLLRRLRIRAFRQFAEATLRVEPGITVITGPNGAGKSTLLEGIVWTLFGAEAVRRSEHTLHPTNLPGVETWGALDVEVGGATISIERALPPDAPQSNAALSGPVELPSRDVFMRACFTGRRELQSLIQLSPAGRVDALARLLRGGTRAAAGDGASSADATLAAAVRALEEELESATLRLATLSSAPDLLTQYEGELQQARIQLAEAEEQAARLHDEWAQKRQDVQTRLDSYRRRGEDLKRQIDRLSASGSAGACPTCDQALGSGIERVIGRLDDEFYITAQDVKWLTQRHLQLERRPPDIAEADTRRERLRALVADRADRAARCEQAVQELWSVAQEQQRARERLTELDARAPERLTTADLEEISSRTATYVDRATDGFYTGLQLTADGRVYALHGDRRAPIVGGGDEDLIALALRLAAAALARRGGRAPDLLLLDEPFGAMDPTRRANMIALLRSELSVAACILITTQDERVATIADAHFRVAREDDGWAAIY